MDALITLLKKYALPDLTPGYLKAFYKEVFQAIADGKLTEEEIAQLEGHKEELGITDEALSSIRQQLYMAAFNNVTADERISDDEWQELEQIQDFLGMSDRDIAEPKKELYRLRILTELRKGNMPIASGTDMMANEDELVHWVEPVEIFEPSKTKKGWVSLGKGECIITNRRVLVKGKAETRSHPLTSILEADCKSEGITLHIPNRRPIRIAYLLPANKDVVASLLLAAIEFARK